MRRVLFKMWIPGVYEDDPCEFSGRKLQPGTNCFQTDFVTPGKFHAWGSAVVELESSVAAYSVAIIEDEAGNVHEVAPCNMMFVQDGPCEPGKDSSFFAPSAKGMEW